MIFVVKRRSIESDPIDPRTPLIPDETARLASYRQLFRNHLHAETIDQIRNATNNTWALGNDRFKQRIAMQLERRVEPTRRGGDRKSDDFRRKAPINRV